VAINGPNNLHSTQPLILLPLNYCNLNELQLCIDGQKSGVSSSLLITVAVEKLTLFSTLLMHHISQENFPKSHSGRME